MKVFLDDIKKHNWLVAKIKETSWGDAFFNLKRPNFFVFNYNLIESESSISVVSAKSLYEINEGIYRHWGNAEHIGYMNEPFDSSNYLFYSLLKSALSTEEEKEKLKDIFIGYKSKDIEDNKRNLKTSIKGSLDINSSISFSDALYKIFSVNKNPVAGLCMVYDNIDQYTKNSFGKSIYGEYLTKIVRAIKNPNGGLLPEYPMSIMRYLIVGEKALLNDEKLIEAKKLFREGNDAYSVYLETGWYFNKLDRKWRKRISDESFYFKVDNFTGNGEEKYLIPEGMS
jgi:hypothetical protein